ncbi:MAG: alpha-L-fucosidase [Candidatus Aminicenantes bacterium]|nr:alpha-L-fucosidase [Candidatus Aminicenantes bacterium]NIM84905.1 alpha-L-fucosidase [Candidatus Aminicenantes bacterium]NIN24416.1 alpha-L-fucosidase [Candidatus Aminicenantes bacterium]NIN48180.1 alpha-L-fucosidase [Candidatus Aminicenantes bacterium]NIN91083.1 alpha-L-fucosidase [Candidatus Aminicenantes bacterium]
MLANNLSKVVIIIFLYLILASGVIGEENLRNKYEFPEDPLVRKKLEIWQDLKFGFMMHWGLYSQLGIVESWALCSEDQPFQDRGGMNYIEFKNMYFNLIKKFNPQKFDPQRWAKAAKEAGMKYVVFTTKHHDGFCMFDTQYTDFKITGADSPFRSHPKANIAREIFNAFRNQGFMIGAYFSKPDWHHPDYWSPLWATPNRNNNYDTRKYPDRWQRFRDFTYNQIKELMTQYGSVDILWLDGGWVRPHHTINDEVRSWGYDISKWEQDIDMPRIARMSRKYQPGILIVDRTVHGPFENYRTPEQRVPTRALPYPWEANMTMTQSWGYNKHLEYKTTKQLIHTLIDVVAKGGNFLLNVGPTPDGTIETEAYKRLEEIGQWMNINGRGIYATRQWQRYEEGNHIRFACSKDRETVYVFLLKWPGKEIRVKSIKAKKNSKIFMLGNDTSLKWIQQGEELVIQIPKALQSPQNRPCQHAWTFLIDVLNK